MAFKLQLNSINKVKYNFKTKKHYFDMKTRKSFYSVLMIAMLIVAGMGLHTVTATPTENDVVGPQAGRQSVIQQALLEYTACYAGVMGVAPRWEVEVKFDYELPMDKDDRWAAATDADPDYLEATIEYNLASLKDVPDQELRQTVVHELVHVSLWELLELIPEEDEDLSLRREEQLATIVSRLPFWENLCRGSIATPGTETPTGQEPAS